MKIFDWEKSQHSEARKVWLKANCHKKMTESEFVDAWQGIKKVGCQPSRAKTAYKSLKKNFGFFQ